MMKFIFIIFTTIIFNISCKDCKPIQIPYEDDEQYEAFIVKEVNLTYFIGQSSIIRNRGFINNPDLQIELPLTNTSDYDGIFKVLFEVKSNQDAISFEESQFIASKQAFTFNITKEINRYTFESELRLSTKVVSPLVRQTQKVLKTRKVIRTKLCYPCQEDCSKY